MPTVEFTDDFNRSNENLEVSADWTKAAGQAAVSSNQVTVSATAMEYILSSASSDADQYAQVTIVTALGAYGINLRSDDDFSDGYHVQFRQSNGDIIIYRKVGGGFAPLTTLTSITHSDGDVISAQVSGTGATVTIEAFIDDVSQGSVEDTNAARITTAGRAGIRTNNTGTVFDDFEAGILADAPAGGISASRRMIVMS